MSWKGALSALACACALVALAGCGDETEEYELVVEGHLTSCVGASDQTCMLTSRDGASPGYEYFGFEGFAFEWGKRVTLQIEETEVDDPPADGSALSKRVIAVLDEETLPEGTEFTMQANARTLKLDSATGLYDFFSQRQVDCATQNLCAALEQALNDAVAQDNGSGQAQLRMAHPATPVEPLVLLEIL